MLRSRALLALTSACFTLACGGDSVVETPPVERCNPGELAGENDTCLLPGVDECGQGFVADGASGCVAVLPAETCAAGLMAVPGDAQCRPVGPIDSATVDPCGDGLWGNLQSDALSQHVDIDYMGGASDGTAQHPWTSIQTAVNSATAGAKVLVAAGVYNEDVALKKQVDVSGRCATLVTLRGKTPNTVRIEAGADGASIRGLSITGPERGIWIVGAANVVIEQVRVFDTTVGGILVGDAPDTQATLRDSLVESPGDMGIWLGGAALTIERSVVRGASGTNPGRGLLAHHGPTTKNSNQLTVRGSVFEDNDNSGLTFSCGSVEIQNSVIRNSRALGIMGAGVAVADCMIADRDTSFVLRGAVLDQNADRGLFLAGVDATVDQSCIRNTTPVKGSSAGLHISQGLMGTLRVGKVTLSRSVIDHNAQAGIAVFGATLTADRIVVSNTSPTPEYPYGHGLHLQSGEAGARSSAAVKGARFQNNAGAGVLLLSADVSLERVAVINELPLDASPMQAGVIATYVPWDTYPSQLRMHDCDVVGSVFFGVYALNSQAHLTQCRVSAIRTAITGRYGDGVAVASGMGVPEASRGSLIIEDSVIDGAARAGLANFGGDVVFKGNTLSCNTIAINGESDVLEGNHQPFTFDDQGGNRCGCGQQLGSCEVLSSALDPLEVPPLELDVTP